MSRRAGCALSSPSISSASRVGLVIVAEEMQKAMHREMGEMMQERLAFVARIRAPASHRRSTMSPSNAAGPVARRGRKRQHIGRLVVAAPVAVERADRRVVGEQDADLAVRAGARRGGRGDRRAHGLLRPRLLRPTAASATWMSIDRRDSCRSRRRRHSLASRLARRAVVGRDDARHQLVADHVLVR